MTEADFFAQSAAQQAAQAANRAAYQSPGDLMEAELPGNRLASEQAANGYQGKLEEQQAARIAELRAKRDALKAKLEEIRANRGQRLDNAAIRAKAYGVDVSAYENARNRDLQGQKMEYDIAQQSLWQNNPEYNQLRTNEAKFIQNYHSAITELNTLRNNNIPENDSQYIEAKNRLDGSIKNLKSIYGRYKDLNVPESLWNIERGDIVDNNNKAQEDIAGKYWHNAKIMTNLAHKLFEKHNGETITENQVKLFLEKEGYDTRDKASYSNVMKEYKDMQDGRRSDDLHNYDILSRKKDLNAQDLEIEAKKNALNVSKNSSDMAKGERISIINFLRQNKPYSIANAKALEKLLKSYNLNVPDNGAKFAIDLFTGANEASYNSQIDVLKNAFPEYKEKEFTGGLD